jgi:hypothetical protein
MISDVRPALTGCRIQRIKMDSRKHTLQIKADRLSILSKAIVQKSKFLLKILLFCGINYFDLYEFITA